MVVSDLTVSLISYTLDELTIKSKAASPLTALGERLLVVLVPFNAATGSIQSVT